MEGVVVELNAFEKVNNTEVVVPHTVAPWEPKMDLHYLPHLKNAAIIGHLKAYSFVHPRAYYDAYVAMNRGKMGNDQMKARLGQMKEGARMLKYGSTPPCDASKIATGDLVRIKMVAKLKRPSATHELADYNSAITELDGSPAYYEKQYKVVAADYDRDQYRLDTLKNMFRRQDLCKFTQFRVGDIVRVSMEHIKRYRMHMGGKQIGHVEGMRVVHHFTRSLFMITHMPGDLTEDGHPAPKIMLDTVFAVGHRVDETFPALYGRLAWESDEDVSKPEDYNPHSSAFYDYQQRVLAGGEHIAQKDLFRGFSPLDLMRVDAQTQDLFWDHKKDGDARLNYLDRDNTYRWFLNSTQERTATGAKDARGYGEKNPKAVFIRTPLMREEFMRERKLKYYRCLQRLRDKDNATVARSVKKTRIYKDKLSTTTCRKHAQFAKWLASYGFV